MKKFLLNIWYTLLFQFDQHRKEIPEWWYEQKAFEQQPDWMQRIAIAKDVIAQIYSLKYRAKRGKYIQFIAPKHKNYFDDEEDIKSNFENIESCQVCAMGACLLSLTKFKNKLNFGDVSSMISSSFNRSRIHDLMLSVFTPEQLALIEIAFEKSSGITVVGRDRYYGQISYDEMTKAEHFNDGNANQRLIAIMENIIDNKGEFKP